MIDKDLFVRDCIAVREGSPLVHNITNYVAMNVAANALLALGASPLMSFCIEEMEEVVSSCSALAINIGCLDSDQTAAMRVAAGAAVKFGKPWVLDPVGVGISDIRRRTCDELIREFHPSVIRGNVSEILCLTGRKVTMRGVDSTADSGEAAEAALLLAKSTGAVVSVSGPKDYISDGNNVESISNGSPIMEKVTAMGCTATAVTAAFAAVDPDPFRAALNAMALMGTLGEQASSKCAGTSSFASAFIDNMSTFNPESVSKLIRQ